MNILLIYNEVNHFTINCSQKLKRIFEFRPFLLFFLPNRIEDRSHFFSNEVEDDLFGLGFI